MKKYYAIPIAAFIACGLILLFMYNYFSFDQALFLDAYSKKLQAPLFTGFLTLSGFLLSLTTFIVVKMHEAVYQDKFYFHRIEAYTRINPEYSHTKPLENLSRFLIVSVIVSLTSSLSHFTIGNISNFHIAIFCLSLSASAFGFTLTACFLIWENIKAWIVFMKEKKLEAFGSES